MSLRDGRSANRRLRHRDPGSDRQRLPDPDRPEGTDLIPQIRHIVLLMMENHSFDNYFAKLGRGDCALSPGVDLPANLDASGAPVAPFHLPSTVQHPNVPSQSWNASHIQFDDGRNDGFPRSVEEIVPGGDQRLPMGYWEESDLPFYSDLARTFALSDRWFSSLLGPTFPNRRFMIAATADGLIDDMAIGLIDYPRSGTIFDLLDRNHISWTNYHHKTGLRFRMKRFVGATLLRVFRSLVLALASVFPQVIKTLRRNIQLTAALYPLGLWRCVGHLKGIDKFFVDAEAGTLPAVSIVDPDFQAFSEENPQDIQFGEGFASSVINAVMNGPGWPGTVLIWFYDEHGGYFDHVIPPEAPEPDDTLPHSLLSSGAPVRWLLGQLGIWRSLKAQDSGQGRYDRYGFRVPAVVVSPFSRPGYVSSTVYDHTSALKLIEKKWNLPPLTARDAAAVAPLDMLDLDNPAFERPPHLAPPAKPWKPG